MNGFFTFHEIERWDFFSTRFCYTKNTEIDEYKTTRGVQAQHLAPAHAVPAPFPTAKCPAPVEVLKIDDPKIRFLQNTCHLLLFPDNAWKHGPRDCKRNNHRFIVQSNDPAKEQVQPLPATADSPFASHHSSPSIRVTSVATRCNYQLIYAKTREMFYNKLMPSRPAPYPASNSPDPQIKKQKAPRWWNSRFAVFPSDQCCWMDLFLIWIDLGCFFVSNFFGEKWICSDQGILVWFRGMIQWLLERDCELERHDERNEQCHLFICQKKAIDATSTFRCILCSLSLSLAPAFAETGRDL